jgi:hypothetical protein
MESNANTPALFQAEKTQFQTKKAISGTLKIKSWVSLLQDLAVEDEAIVGKTKVVNTKIFINNIIVVAIIGAAIFTKIYLLLWLLLLPLVYMSKLQKSEESLKKVDIENHFRLYALPLLRILEQESSENQKIKLSLDCNNPEQKAYQISERITDRAVYPRFTNTTFRLMWLDAQLELADDSFLHIKITDDIRRVERARYNPRGRMKYKTKRKISQTVAIKISFSKERYTLIDKAAAEETATHFSFKLKEQTTQKTINTNINFDSYNDMQPLLRLLARAYASVKPM